MAPRTKSQEPDYDGLSRIIKQVVTGHEGAHAQLNGSLENLANVLGVVSGQLSTANETIARQAAEIAETRKANFERDLAVMDRQMAAEKQQFDGQRRLMVLDKVLGYGDRFLSAHVLSLPESTEAEPNQANVRADAEPNQAKVLAVCIARVMRALSPETVARLQSEAGTDVCDALVAQIQVVMKKKPTEAEDTG